MKKFLLLLILILPAQIYLQAQQNFTAIITAPRIGSDSGSVFLQRVVEDINGRNGISNIVVLGDLTANGLFSEFDECKIILDELKKPYFVSGGRNDYLLSELNGMEIIQNWGDGKFSFQAGDYNIFVINTVNRFSEKGFVDVETIDWLKENSGSSKVNFIFAYYPVKREVINGFKILNGLAGSRIISVYPGKDIKKKKKEKLPLDEIKTKSLSSGKEWNYQLLSVKNDTLFYYNVSPKDSLPELISSVRLSEIEAVRHIDSSDVTIYNKNLSIHWQKDFHTTTESEALVTDDKIFTANKNGLVTCFDKNGNKKWGYETSTTITANLLRDKDLVVAGSLEGDLFTINANNGDLVQVIGTGETISSNLSMIDIQYNDLQTKGIIFGTAAGNIYCYELYSLELVWDGYLTDNKIVSVTKAGKDKIIFKDNKEMIYCVNASNGVLIWKWRAKTKTVNRFFNSDVISDNNHVYISDADGLIHCIDLLLGTEKWKRKVSSTGKLSFTNDKKYIVTRTGKNKIVLLSLKNGNVKKEVNLLDDLKESKLNFISAESNGIYLGFDNGVLYKINKKNKIEKIISAGTSPLISFSKINGKGFVINSLDGKILSFRIK